MKLFVLFLSLLSLPASAAEFKNVTPVLVGEIVTRWEFEYLYRWKPWNPLHPIASIQPKSKWRTMLLAEYNCHQPMIGDPKDRRFLIRPPSVCFETEDEGKAAAQKEADKLESDVLGGVYGEIK